MPEPHEPNQTQPPAAKPDAGEGPIPLAPEPAPAASPSKPARIIAKPVLALADDKCPKCGEPMDAGAVVCIKCGYDLKANVQREPEVGVEHEKPETSEFVTPGRGTVQILVGAGAVLTIGAMVAAGVNAPGGGAWLIVGSVLLVLYNTLLHTGTGVVAVFCAAKLTEQKFSRVDMTAARILAAFALFQLIISLHFPLGPAIVGGTLKWLVATGGYWLAVLFLFKKDRMAALLILLCHFILWVLVQMGMFLTAWVSSAAAAAPVPPAAG